MKIDQYEVLQINSTTWRIEGDISRAFLFLGKEKAMLVDTTEGKGDLKKVVDTLSDPLPLLVVNTHADADHIGCNHQFDSVFMHPSEFSYYALKAPENAAVPVVIEEGESIDLGSRKFEVIHLPGHTCGSIALLNREERILVAGDTILPSVFIFGEFRNLRALIFSLEKLRDRFFGDFDVIYGSHHDYQIGREFILQELACAKAHLEGRLQGTDPGRIPLEPPDFRPAAAYTLDGSTLFDFA